MILFFETYSIMQTLFLIRYIRKAKRIIFHKKTFPSLTQNRRVKSLVEKIIRIVNKNVRIETLPVEMINKYNWVLNKKAVDIADKISSFIKETVSYRIISKIIGDGNILKYYKARMVNDISAKLLFSRMADELSSECDEVLIIPSNDDFSDIQREVIDVKTLDKYFLPPCVIVNQIKKGFLNIYAAIVLLILPSVFIIWNLRKLRLNKNNKKTYDIAMPVMAGFHKEDVKIGGVKQAQDDGYLYNEKIKIGNIVHIFNNWRFGPEVEKNYKRVMDEKGIPYIDSSNYCMHVNLVIIAAKIQFKILYYFLVNLFCLNFKYGCMKYSISIIFAMLKKYLELQNIDYKVLLIRNDYNPKHIIDTIMCNQYNRKTIGIQHYAGPQTIPMLSYVHLDKHIVFGEIFIDLFAPHWKDIELVKTGRQNIDWVIDILKNKDEITRLRKLYLSKYKRREKCIVVAFPSGADYNLKGQWEEMYNALSTLKRLKGDFNLFLRFRGTAHLDDFEHIKRFRTLPNIDDRILINHDDFTTQELMVLSDLFIAPCHSSSVYEALAAGSKVFTFDYMGTAKYFFPECGKDFILYNRDDVLHVFEGLKTNFAGFDCNWDGIKRRGNFYYDGRNLERIQEAVYSTIEEVDAETFSQYA